MTVFKGYSYKELMPLVRHCLEKRKSVLVKGHPGVGKSTMAAEIATAMGFNINDPTEFIEIRLADRDPVELRGLIVPDRERKISEWFRSDWIPVNKRAFIFLDEINAAVTKLHQAVAYQIVLERRLGEHKFHPDTVIMAAGNLEEDNAIVTPFSSALNNRFMHFILKVDVDAWLEWAVSANLPAAYRGYIAFRGEQALYDNNGSDAWPSPRSNATAATLTDDCYDNGVLRRLVSGCIGEAHANEYMTYLEVYSRIDLAGIVERGAYPDLVKENEASFQYALIFGIVDYISRKKISQKEAGNIFGLFASGLSSELKTLFFNQVMTDPKFNPDSKRALQQHPAFIANAKESIELLAA